MRTGSRTLAAVSFALLFVLGVCSGGEKAPSGHVFTKPIQIIVFNAPGAISDLSARVFADNLSRHIGQSVVVVNMVGAGGSIAAHKVDESPKDGATLLYIEEGTLTNAAAGTLDMSWRDFEIVSYFGDSTTQMLVTSKNTGYTDMKSMIEFARKNGGELTTAITLGNPTHFQTSAIQRATGITLRPIDVGTGADKMTAILTGQVQTTPGSLDNLQDYINSGELVCLGMMGANRSSLAPNLPTIKEQGFDLGVDFIKFFIIGAPKGTPAKIVEALDHFTKVTLEDPKTMKAYASLYLNPNYKSGPDAAKFLADREVLYNNLAKFMGLR